MYIKLYKINYKNRCIKVIEYVIFIYLYGNAYRDIQNGE